MDKQDFKGIIPFKTAEDYNSWRAGTFTKGGEDFPKYNQNILAVLPDEQSQYVETGIEERVEQLEANAGGGKLYLYTFNFTASDRTFSYAVNLYSTREFQNFQNIERADFINYFGNWYLGFDMGTFKSVAIYNYLVPGFVDQFKIDGENKLPLFGTIQATNKREV